MEQDVWTIRRILSWIEGYLRDRGDGNPRLSAQWLVSDALGMSRLELYLDPDRPLSEGERATLRDYTRRRGAGEPLQYITGTTDFRFITVEVEHGVLIPRPETEVLVSEALARIDAVGTVKRARLEATGRAAVREAGDRDGYLADNGEEIATEGITIAEVETSDWEKVPSGGDTSTISDSCHGKESSHGEETHHSEDEGLLVADLCTGSGCIACAIATEIPHAHVIATDIDPKAIALARRNAQRLGVSQRVQILECDLGCGIDDHLMGSFDLVISNPPYIPTNMLSSLDGEVTGYESSLALDGGEDGLDTFRRLLPFALEALAPQGVIAVELHETCLDQAREIAEDMGFSDISIANDLAGRPRVLLARKG